MGREVTARSGHVGGGQALLPLILGAKAPLREWALAGDLVVLHKVGFFLF